MLQAFSQYRAGGFTCSEVIDLFIRNERVRNGEFREYRTRTREMKNRNFLGDSERKKSYWKNLFQLSFQCKRKIRAFPEEDIFISSAALCL